MKKLPTNKSSLLYSERGISLVPESSNQLSWFQRIAKHLLFKKVQDFQYGKLTIIDQDGQTCLGQQNSPSAPQATIVIHDPRFYSQTLLGGSIGGAESYIRGDWSCTDLTQVVRVLALNDGQTENLESGAASFAMGLYHFGHALRNNSQKGSKKNISAHYDLSNEFFQLFLDPNMMYSSAIFKNENTSLEEASLAKLERICQKLDLQPEDHLLEIGTGWGGMAIYAAKHYGCRVTTTTISQKQYELAVQRIQAEDLSQKITVLCQDYRTLEGQYDKLVSIEMIEAVGHQHYQDYFKICSERLKPEGMMLLQSITTDDQKYDKVVNEVDFIQKYIFPGGCLPSLTEITNAIKHSTNMRMFQMEDIGAHYAKTLRLWRTNFSKNLNQVLQLGFSEEFIRMWDYYFCYCEGLFEERRISAVQILFSKPLCRRHPIVPDLS